MSLFKLRFDIVTLTYKIVTLASKYTEYERYMILIKIK